MVDCVRGLVGLDQAGRVTDASNYRKVQVGSRANVSLTITGRGPSFYASAQ